VREFHLRGFDRTDAGSREETETGSDNFIARRRKQPDLPDGLFRGRRVHYRSQK
jgi:hypothetical protein